MKRKKHFIILNMIILFTVTLFGFSKRAESCLDSKSLGPVNKTSETFENPFLLLRLGLPPTIIRRQNRHDGALRKRSSKRRK